MKKRVALLVYVDLDPVPGVFYTPESALHYTAGILDNQIGHYNPIVSLAPDELQPPNFPRGPSISQEIARPVSAPPPIVQAYNDAGVYDDPDTTGEIPIAGASHPNTGVFHTSELAMTYNTEGSTEA